MGGKIDCYIDLGEFLLWFRPERLTRVTNLLRSVSASFYSYLAFNELLRNYETLKAYGVEVE
jgi:hypothetical protein